MAQVSNFDRLLCPLYAISFGNQIDLTVTDYLEYLKDDEDVKVFAVYLEGFRPYRGRRFIEVADETVKADFNHPLAGERLTFDVKVATVREATEAELTAVESCSSSDCNPGGCSSCGGH